MADVRIAHLRKRYRMPGDAVSERPRLDRVLQSAFDDELFDAALERAGIPAGEEICIRRVDAAVRLDCGQPDERLAVAWSVALADAVAHRVSEGGPDVIRYRTRFLALVDMACSATRGDFERAWAWKSLGIWRAGDVLAATEARAEVIAALAREPRLAPATLSVVARRGLLSLLVSSVPVERWVALARASLVEWGVSEAEIRWLVSEQGDVEGDGESSAMAAASRIAESSPVARASRVAKVAGRVGDASAVTALAVLALLECEPALVASTRGTAVVRLLAQRMSAEASNSTPERIAGQNRIDARGEASGVAATEAKPIGGSDRANRDDSTDGDSPNDARVPATTKWGGLLFLLHIVHALDIPTTLLRDSVLSTRSLRWSLHQLAMLLVPIAADDAAALVFAGLAPRSRAPSLDELPATDAEAAALRGTCEAMLAALRERMSAKDDESDTALVERMTLRNAVIVAEPAWIEIRLATTELRTDVRRAGLDFDPGWIPWLGVVVRFAYV